MRVQARVWSSYTECDLRMYFTCLRNGEECQNQPIRNTIYQAEGNVPTDIFRATGLESRGQSVLLANEDSTSDMLCITKSLRTPLLQFISPLLQQIISIVTGSIHNPTFRFNIFLVDGILIFFTRQKDKTKSILNQLIFTGPSFGS